MVVTHIRHNFWLLPVWQQAIAGRLLAKAMPQPARQQKKMAPKAHLARFTHQGAAGPIYSSSGRRPFAKIWWPPGPNKTLESPPFARDGSAPPRSLCLSGPGSGMKNKAPSWAPATVVPESTTEVFVTATEFVTVTESESTMTSTIWVTKTEELTTTLTFTSFTTMASDTLTTHNGSSEMGFWTASTIVLSAYLVLNLSSFDGNACY
ncbi:hypothetical protein BFW01_g10847 [Lasiodiplodia theobromae]|uniref:Uncharacterized protein n=1 Tax=Lasiodiplodia theobromae TaxID=45133 RepID=A0A8H7IQ95_9PEZI|nr:hypothetical protein BFW01_g10847 [Lasiodiplodia theobromae]